MIYRQLQKHFDKLPVAFPAARSGSDIKVLKHLFNEEEAEIALSLGYEYQSAEKVFDKISAKLPVTYENLADKLRAMAAKGCIFVRYTDGGEEYALVPLMIGMFELQGPRLSLGLLKDFVKYLEDGFGFEYLSNKPQQMRVIPIEKSVNVKNRIPSYEDIEALIESSQGGLSVVDCICKKSWDLYEKPCKVTDKREVCLAFGEMSEYCVKHDFGRRISKDEALSLMRSLQEAGLVLQTTGEQDVQVVCACCRCCCGVLKLYSQLPSPRDFVASNHIVEFRSELCKTCGLCAKRCSMRAIHFDQKRAEISINLNKCIGCGVCVPVCKSGALRLKDKETWEVPPITTKDLYDEIGKNRNEYFSKVKMILKLLLTLKKDTVKKRRLHYPGNKKRMPFAFPAKIAWP
ncbi:MAG: 4Fe-4S binding protein, partial [Oligoflexales bacterium]|nr:4Fe-4S binding protein [Oligoflexales bacterium]